MNKIVDGVIVFFGICLALLGVVFLIAGSPKFLLIGDRVSLYRRRSFGDMFLYPEADYPTCQRM